MGGILDHVQCSMAKNLPLLYVSGIVFKLNLKMRSIWPLHHRTKYQEKWFDESCLCLFVNMYFSSKLIKKRCVLLVSSSTLWQNVSTFISLKMRNNHFHSLPEYHFDNEISSDNKILFVFFVWNRSELKQSVNKNHAKHSAFSLCLCVRSNDFNFFMLNGSRRQKCTQNA